MENSCETLANDCVFLWAQATMYNPQIQQPQYYQQLYGPSSSTMGSPYYYGYSMQAPRGTFSTTPQPHRMPAGPSYLYYPTPMEGSFPAYRPPPQLQQLAIRQPSPFPSGTFLFTSPINCVWFHVKIFKTMFSEIWFSWDKSNFSLLNLI